LNPAINLVQEGPGGHVDNEYMAIAGGQPAISFSTSAIKKALDACGWDGTPISDLNPFEAWFRQGQEGGTRLTGANHVKMLMVKGLCYPMSIRAPHVPAATIDYNCIATWDEAVLPIQITKGAALDADAAPDQLYAAGPVVLGGQQAEGIQDITVTFGIQPEVQGHKGLEWATYIGIRQRLPQVTIRFQDSEEIERLQIDGLGITTCDVYLRRCKEGGTREPDASPLHIKLSMVKCLAVISDSGATTPNITDNTIIITPALNRANPPTIDIDTLSALP